ncbi:rhomboid-like protein [Actinoplanes sp. NPDC051346]|uniref:rhomboid-like protein n=1 Tax=Actinoplanes sp. NPDC051346 TaxID=3155048 RepID=UPI00343E84F0
MNPQPQSGPLDGLLRAVGEYPRRAPLTLGYVCLLLAVHAVVHLGLPEDRADRLLDYVSTNLDNLQNHPVTAMLASVLFIQTPLTDVTSLEFVGTVITLGLGVCGFLAWAEHRWGKRRAVALFLFGHVAATLLTAVVITVALREGWYPAAVRHAPDFGISYGAQTVLAIGTLAVPRWGRLPWALFVLAWPIGGADDSTGPLPDFATVGHLVAATLGFALLAVPAVRRPRAVTGHGAGPGPSRVPEPTSPAGVPDPLP